MYLITGAIVLFVLAVLAAVRIHIKRKQHAAQEQQAQTTRQAIEQEIKKGISEHALDLKMRLKAKFTSEELKPFKKQVNDALENIKKWHASTTAANGELNTRISAWNAGRQTEELVLAGKAVLLYLNGRTSFYLTNRHLHKATIDRISKEMPRLLGQYYDDLAASAASDATAFAKLSELINEARTSYRWMELNELPIPSVPDNWHAIVDQHVENPDLDEYFYIDSHAEGSLRLMAARAVLEQDSSEAKYLLALSRHQWHIRIARELSPQMCDELAKVVERVHIQREAAKLNT